MVWAINFNEIARYGFETILAAKYLFTVPLITVSGKASWTSMFYSSRNQRCCLRISQGLELKNVLQANHSLLFGIISVCIDQSDQTECWSSSIKGEWLQHIPFLNITGNILIENLKRPRWDITDRRYFLFACVIHKLSPEPLAISSWNDRGLLISPWLPIIDFSIVNYQKREAKYAYLRAKLQSKGTRSAKNFSGRSAEEQRFVSEVNHCISKELWRCLLIFLPLKIWPYKSSEQN